ncbi:MAG: hypothetical protein GY816_04710, partial [Cytophagales bacterium]|nr:hypothetical protein [Cytophagales bacterium]
MSTFYRVGTLGLENFQEFERHFKSLASNKKLHKHILIGDFNFKDVRWPEGISSSDLQQKFLDFLVGDLGHTQLIHNATHKSGNILDLVFTNIPELVKNLKVLDQNESCFSDHFGLIFDISIKIKHKKIPKQTRYNYGKANWIALNRALRNVNWLSALNCTDPHTSWPRFKTILTDLCNRYIPKVSVKSKFQPPWYDSKADRIREKKEHWRKLKKDATNEIEWQS